MRAPFNCHSFIIAAFVAGCSVAIALGFGTNCNGRSPDPDKPASAEHGRQLFVQSCAHCHGDDARGDGEDGDGPDLHGLRIGNARIANVIHTGIPEEMPSFARKHGPPDVADLTAYLRSLQ